MDEDNDTLAITKGNTFIISRCDFYNNKVVLGFSTMGVKTIKLTMKEHWLVVKVEGMNIIIFYYMVAGDRRKAKSICDPKLCETLVYSRHTNNQTLILEKRACKMNTKPYEELFKHSCINRATVTKLH